MMNRIILIGNGFDLAHGLPTSYADFIRGYNITLKLGLLEGEYERYDGLCSVNISDPEDRKTLEQFRWMLQDNTFRFIRIYRPVEQCLQTSSVHCKGAILFSIQRMKFDSMI